MSSEGKKASQKILSVKYFIFLTCILYPPSVIFFPFRDWQKKTRLFCSELRGKKGILLTLKSGVHNFAFFKKTHFSKTLKNLDRKKIDFFRVFFKK